MAGDSALISVIVTTYNRPDALKAVLDGMAAQRDGNFEVIVADDGSGPETAEAVAAMKPHFPAALSHVWHPDEGFRAGTIRNRAVSTSRGDSVIFLDGDCVPRRHFVAAHRAAAEAGWMVRGSRALLSHAATARVLASHAPVHSWSTARWLAARLRGEVNRFLPLAGVGRISSSRPRDWRSVRTCNLAVWRRDLEAVNGFDERFVGWGYEDSDLAIRLLNHGVRIRRAGAAATVIHLWHRENDRRFEGENLARLRATETSGTIRSTLGIAEGGAALRGPAAGASL